MQFIHDFKIETKEYSDNNSIKEYVFNKKFLLYRRAVFFYLQRFKSDIPGIISFFRDTIKIKISFKKRKTIKLIEMIKDSPSPNLRKKIS